MPSRCLTLRTEHQNAHGRWRRYCVIAREDAGPGPGAPFDVCFDDVVCWRSGWGGATIPKACSASAAKLASVERSFCTQKVLTAKMAKDPSQIPCPVASAVVPKVKLCGNNFAPPNGACLFCRDGRKGSRIPGRNSHVKFFRFAAVLGTMTLLPPVWCFFVGGVSRETTSQFAWLRACTVSNSGCLSYP